MQKVQTFVARFIIALIAALLAMAAAARTMEVYVSIPQGASVHCTNADVEWDAKTLMVTIRMPWGVTYYTHMSNVVMVERRRY